MARATISRPIVHESYTRELPGLGSRVHVFTLVNEAGDKEVIALDDSDAPVALDDQLAADAAALRGRCGRLSAAACAAAAAAPGKQLPVMIWVIDDQAPADRTLARADAARFAAQRSAVAAARQARVEAAATAIERTLGRSGLRRSSTAPVVEGRLTASELAAVSALPTVGAIDLADDRAESDLAQSLGLARWSVPHAEADGTGVRVGILELNRPDVVTELPALTIRDTTTGTVDDHSRLVTGIIHNTSTGGVPNGYAPDASIYIANLMAGESGATTADIDWATSQLTAVHNQSWHQASEQTSGALSARDKYLDYQTYFNTKFYSLAAGNVVYGGGETDAEFVNHKGYNVVTVAATYDDGFIVDNSESAEGTCGVSGWSSTFRNDSAGQELPHLSANGAALKAVGESCKSGTSFAAPAVTGLAAGLTEFNATFHTWPEALKATLLASPGVVGSPTSERSPDGCPWRFRRDAGGACTINDGRDGTGLVDGTWAERIASNPVSSGNPPASYGFTFGALSKASFDPTTHLSTMVWNARGNRPTGSSCFFLGRRLKTVVAWDSNVSCTGASCTDSLNMDIDLLIYEEPGHTLFAQSATTANSYEVIDAGIRDNLLSCTPSGTAWSYSIVLRLNNYATVSSTESTYFGLAWHAYPE